MPLDASEQAFLGEPTAEGIDYEHQRLEYSPAFKQRIGKWTIVALVLNRTIGSGIFLTPHKVLAGTGCVGGALLIWMVGAGISLCGLYVWLECGLSMPQRAVRGENEPRGVPRSGGEKNYLEFMFPNQRYRTTCTFAIMFILLYNLSGNALSFGLQMMVATGLYDNQSSELPNKSTAVGIAIAALTFAILLHTFSRRGGIIVNNGFAILKVFLLLVVIGLGFAKAGGAFGGMSDGQRKNFTKDVFKTERHDVASWSSSLVFCMYSFSGFEQPFYVLAETKSPRRYFPRYTILAMAIATVLFLLVNIVFLIAVPKDRVIPGPGETPSNVDMATLFFDSLFQDQTTATRALAALISISIFGNIVVMTFTAARVKQEIAKEGILPWSLTFATSHTTPYGMWKKWQTRHYQRRDADLAAQLEQSPVAAFALHWFTSVLLILVTLPIADVRTSYQVLVSLYSYTIITLLGAWVSIGLLITKLRRETWHWQDRRRYRPWLSPVHVIIYGTSCIFLCIASFAPPSFGSPYHASVTKFEWYIVPCIGLSAPLWGLAWWVGLLIYQKIKRRDLRVTRTPFWMKDPDCPSEYIQRAEIIDHAWQPRPRSARANFGFTQTEDDDEQKDSFAMTQVQAVPSDSGSEADQPHPFTRKDKKWMGFGRPNKKPDRMMSGGFTE